jgi:hypothetical protein
MEAPRVPGAAGMDDPRIPFVLKGRPACHSNKTSSSGLLTGKVLIKTVSTTLNKAVFAPIPNARVTTATAVNPKFLRKMRNAYLRSCQRVSIFSPQSLSSTVPANFLFVPQRDQRIDLRCPPRRNEAGQ